MKNKCRLFMICLLIAAVVLLEPVSYAMADDTTSGENYDRNNGIPRPNSSQVEFTIKEFFDWFGLADVPEENVFKEFILSHKKVPNVDYSLYDLVCDFEFKTMGDDGSVTTSTYSYTIDFDYYDVSWSSDRISVDDNLVYNYSKKSDGEDIFYHEFIYKNIIKNAEGFKERPIFGKKNYNTYNTVISQVDFYFVRESDGEIGQARRYVFGWDSNFWLQKCVEISYYWYDHENDLDKEIYVNEDENGIYDSSSGEESAWSKLLGMIVDAPLILGAIFVGFTQVVIYLSGLFHAAFPFIPAIVFNIFACVILLFIFVAILNKVVSRLL